MLKVFGAAVVMLAGGAAPCAAFQPEASEAVASVLATPFVIGGVRLTPEEMTVASGGVRRRGVLLHGTASHAGTARLTRHMTVRAPLLKTEAEAGTVLHLVELVTDGPDQDQVTRIWCSDLGQKTVFGSGSPPVCFIEGDPLRRAFTATNATSWLSTSSTAMGHIPGRADHFEIEPSDTDLIGAMDVRFELARIGRDSLTLRLVAEREGRSITVLTMVRPLQNGEAVLPLWTHTLRMKAEGGEVTVNMTADGDGTGPAGLFRSTYPQ